jgi:integrase/recombinase XerD
VLTAVRGMVVHAVAAGQAGGGLVPLLYEVADDRDLPGAARAEDGQMSWRTRARHRLHEPETLWTGPPTRTSSRCWARAARRGTG